MILEGSLGSKPGNAFHGGYQSTYLIYSRLDFNATIAYALELPLDSPAGRPFTAARMGKPITALF